jgi:hypothetical protein
MIRVLGMLIARQELGENKHICFSLVACVRTMWYLYEFTMKKKIKFSQKNIQIIQSNSMIYFQQNLVKHQIFVILGSLPTFYSSVSDRIAE